MSDTEFVVEAQQNGIEPVIFERDAKGMRFLHRSGEPYPVEP